MTRKVDLLLLGASALALGVAEAHPEKKILVLERGFSVAGEFSAAFKTDNAWDYAPKTAAAEDLRREFSRRGALDASGEWLPAIQPVLAKRFLKSGAKVFFSAALKEIRADGEDFSVVFTSFGLDHTVRAAGIVDTTAIFLSREFFGEKEPEMKRATLNHFDTDLCLHQTPAPGGIAAARGEILSRYSSILRIAPELALEPEEKQRPLGGAVWAPSGARGNFLAAFDDGFLLSIPVTPKKTAAPTVIRDGEYDLVVVGLGTAGSAAAAAAREEGLTVLGLEDRSVCGGAATAGGVPGYYFGYKGGLYQKIDEKTALLRPRFPKGVGADAKAGAIDSFLEGCDVRFGAALTGVKCEGGRVTGVRWSENGAFHEAASKFVIDATADSAACIAAGCETLGGRESDGAMEPFSSMQFLFDGGVLKAKSADDGRVDQYDPDALGKSVLEAYSSPLHLWEDYSDHRFLGIAPLLGLREGRRIAGEETVSFSSVVRGERRPDAVYYGFSNFDNHGKDCAFESDEYQAWNTVCGLWGWGIGIPVPAGALIPKGFDGILAAGRNVSCDHDVATALRMKDDVQKSGEAASRLAALAIRRKIPAKKVDVRTLREELFASGCLKPEDETPRLEKQKTEEIYEGDFWRGDEAALEKALASNSPGYAMYAAFMLGKRDLLEKLLDSADGNTRVNAALALSLCGGAAEKTVSILCGEILKGDGYIPGTSRAYVPPRAVAAICALGRIASPAALPTLYRLIRDESYLASIPLEPSGWMADREDLAFEYRTHLVASLCSIAKAHPEKREEIRAALLDFARGKRFTVTLKKTAKRHDDTALVLRMIEEL